MRKAILMMLLTVMSSSAMAEWVKVGRIERYTAYADPSTIRKDGNIVKMWELTDYKTLQTVAGIKPFMSTKVQQEYDCNLEQERILYMSFHSGNMGGDVVYSESTPDAKWYPVPPGSISNSMWKFACGKANGNGQADAEKTLDALQPDWRQVVNSTAFRNWMTTLPKGEQDKLNGSWDPYYIADKITEFNKNTATVGSGAAEEWVKVSSTIFIGKESSKSRGKMLLSGEIIPGDAEIVASALGKTPTLLLQLDSKGGDVAEAIKIASLVKGAHLATKVAPNGFCASACFFLYLAGDTRAAAIANDDGTLPKKRYSKMGYLGIHRPFLKAPSGDQNSMNKQKEVMQKIRSYLASEGVSQYLIDEMMSRPSNDIYWLPEREINNFEMNAGLEEALISKCGYKRVAKRVSEKWTKEQDDRLMECENIYFSEITLPARQQFLTKLRTGWRPWKKK